MADTSKIAKNLERFAQAIAAHDRENPTHTAWGIGLAHFDLERLGLEEGEEILPGIVIQADNGVTGNFRVLCDGQHDGEREAAEEEVVEAVVMAYWGGLTADEISRRIEVPLGTAKSRIRLGLEKLRSEAGAGFSPAHV